MKILVHFFMDLEIRLFDMTKDMVLIILKTQLGLLSFNPCTDKKSIVFLPVSGLFPLMMKLPTNCSVTQKTL